MVCIEISRSETGGRPRGASESGGCAFPHARLAEVPGAPRWWVGGEAGIRQVIRPFGRFAQIWASGKGCRAVSLLGQDYKALPVSETATELTFLVRKWSAEAQRLGGLALARQASLLPKRPGEPLQGTWCCVPQGQSGTEALAASPSSAPCHCPSSLGTCTFKSYFRSSLTSDSL